MMRSVVILTLVSLTGPLACSSVRTLDRTDIETVTLRDVDADPEAFASRLTGDSRGVVLDIKRGERLPIALTLESPVLALEAGENRIRFDRDVFLYLSPTEILVSPEGERWCPVGDLGGLKSLFGVSGGQLSFGFGVSKQAGATVALSVKTE